MLPSPWGIVAVAVALVVDLAEIAFGFWYTKRRRPQAGAETLIGADALVVLRCDPLGQVRVQGELWQARSDPPAARGETVRVQSVGPDLILDVRPVGAA